MSNWKQQNREWTANYKRELREREEARQAASEQRTKQNAILRANGYRWTKSAGSAEDNAFGGTYDSWMLLDPAGNETTVAKAMEAITGKTAEQRWTSYECRHHDHAICGNKKACTCDCHQHGAALVAVAPEVTVATVEKPSRFAPLPTGCAVAQQADGRYVVIIAGQVATKVLKSGEIRIRSYAHKSSARRYARQHGGQR